MVRHSLAIHERGGVADERSFTPEERQLYLAMIDQVGTAWIDVFEGDTEFYSAAYWDLLTEIWRSPGPVRKTDALKFMKAIKSAHTAGKYIDEAVRVGLIVESDNPKDARSKLLRLAPDMRKRLDRFFDRALAQVITTSKSLGP